MHDLRVIGPNWSAILAGFLGPKLRVPHLPRTVEGLREHLGGWRVFQVEGRCSAFVCGPSAFYSWKTRSDLNQCYNFEDG